jgi:signal transduction histidine kinase/DNA-binding response OmpR family regulator
MKPKSIQLPFLFIIAFSVIFMAGILLTQNQFASTIKQLKAGNSQAVRTIKVDNLVNDIINEIFVIVDQSRNFITTNDSRLFQHLQDTINLLENDKKIIQQLAIFNDSNKLLIARFTSLIERKTAPSKKLSLTSSGEEKAEIVSALTSEMNKQVADSIYTLALGIQLKFEKDLETTIIKNELLSDQVLSLGKILGLISIVAICILATIIILRLLKYYQLIRALHRAKLQTEQAANIKEQFLSNMSHEIRTPINSVIGFTSLLQKSKMTNEQGQFVGLIKSASENLLNIVNDILDISKIEAGMLHFDKNPFSLRELSYSLEMMFYHSTTEKGLSYEWIIDDNVPEILIGDKERLTQILNNLVNNALKFTENGGITIRISLSKTQDQIAVIQFSVKDTGIGIQPDKLESIFNRFEQAENNNTKNFGGTGLGLSIVKKLVTMQEGNILAKSEPGIGSEFIIQIPFGIGQEDTINKVKFGSVKNICPVNGTKNLAGYRVLAAEDNKMNQMLLTYIFQQWNLDFDLVDNGQKAIECLQHNTYDLVLMDIQMPVMDGYSTTTFIRNELKNDIPVIAMTAKVLPGEREKCQGLGMNHYISKPINEDILYDVLITYISKNHTTGNRLLTGNTVDKIYLKKIYKENNQFINGLVQQFLQQYPKELDALQTAVNTRDYNTVVAGSHNMKTTVLSLNPESPLLEHLEKMENAENIATGWEIIQYRLNLLLDCREKVLKESNQYLGELIEE